MTLVRETSDGPVAMSSFNSIRSFIKSEALWYLSFLSFFSKRAMMLSKSSGASSECSVNAS